MKALENLIWQGMTRSCLPNELVLMLMWGWDFGAMAWAEWIRHWALLFADLARGRSQEILTLARLVRSWSLITLHKYLGHHLVLRITPGWELTLVFLWYAFQVCPCKILCSLGSIIRMMGLIQENGVESCLDVLLTLFPLHFQWRQRD